MCDIEDYQSFFDNAPIALCRTDLETGKFQMANDCAVELFGCGTKNELLQNHKSTDFYDAEIRSKLVKKLKRQGAVEDQEIELHLPDGKNIWIKASFRMSEKGSCIECYLTDITEIVKLREIQLGHMKSISLKLDSKIKSLAG